MDRGNGLTLLLPKWGSNPIPSDMQSEMQTIAPKALASNAVFWFYVNLVTKAVILVFVQVAMPPYSQRKGLKTRMQLQPT
jgi:hypothetical protein